MENNQSHSLIFIKFFVVLSFSAMVFVNVLAILLPINGLSEKELSSLYANLFTPAPYTFSIWTVIYLALAGFVFFQLNPPMKGAGLLTAADLQKIRMGFIVSCLLNGLWLFSWHHQELALSVFLMLLLLMTLMYINRFTRKHTSTQKHKVLLRLPFSLYFGWVTVTAFANVTVLLTELHWEVIGASSDISTLLILVSGTLLAAAIVIINRDPVYGLVILWAYGGILMNHLFTENGGRPHYSVMIVTVACMVTMIIATAASRLAKG